MRLGVLLRNAEVDVEQAEVAGRGRIRRLAIKNGLQPVDVNELLVLREPVDPERRVGRPGSKARLVDAGALDAEADQPLGQPGRLGSACAVDGDLAVGGDALAREQPGDLGLVDGVEPRDRERNGARDVAAAERPLVRVVGHVQPLATKLLR